MARRKTIRQGRRQTLPRRNHYSRGKVSNAMPLHLPFSDPPITFSVVTLDKCVRNFTKFTGCSIGEAIKCVTYNPAKSVQFFYAKFVWMNLTSTYRCLNIENKKGTLRPGVDADLVVLDRHGNVLSTWIKGKKVWDEST